MNPKHGSLCMHALSHHAVLPMQCQSLAAEKESLIVTLGQAESNIIAANEVAATAEAASATALSVKELEVESLHQRLSEAESALISLGYSGGGGGNHHVGLARDGK